LLTERRLGTDSSQGKGQIISNINACLAVQATIRSTLGPYGGDLLLVDANGRQTITNDGATVMKVRSWFIVWELIADERSFLISSTLLREF
jgi:T-complex protein 1 subunit eta